MLTKGEVKCTIVNPCRFRGINRHGYGVNAEIKDTSTYHDSKSLPITVLRTGSGGKHHALTTYTRMQLHVWKTSTERIILFT